MDRAVLAAAVGMLYFKAEEEAVRLRRAIRERRARMRRRSRRLMAYLSTSVHFFPQRLFFQYLRIIQTVEIKNFNMR